MAVEQILCLGVARHLRHAIVISLRVGDTFNDCYEVLGLLGRGGTSSVYRCRDTRLRRLVAVKVLDWGSDEDLRLRLEREARIVASLSHPGIVGIHDIAVDDGTLFIVQEYLAGCDLSAAIAANTRGKGLPRAVAAKVAVAVAEALHFAHEAGVVHRDIKPGNIRLLPHASVKVLDFGIATARRSDPMHLTQPGSQIGTPAYMSPSSSREMRSIHDRTFILSALFATRCWRVSTPYQTNSPYEHAALVLTKDHAPSLQTWDVPEEVTLLIDSCLNKSVESRPASMGALLQTFRSWLERFDAEDILGIWPAPERAMESVAHSARSEEAADVTPASSSVPSESTWVRTRADASMKTVPSTLSCRRQHKSLQDNSPQFR